MTSITSTAPQLLSTTFGRGVIVVAYTEPGDEKIRIISARRATKCGSDPYRRHNEAGTP